MNRSSNNSPATVWSQARVNCGNETNQKPIKGSWTTSVCLCDVQSIQIFDLFLNLNKNKSNNLNYIHCVHKCHDSLDRKAFLLWMGVSTWPKHCNNNIVCITII